MSAAEIIEQFERLPQHEQAIVRDYLNSKTAGSGTPAFQRVPREVLEKSAEKIFREHEELFRKLAQ